MNLPQQPINAFEKHLQKAKIAYLPKRISILDIGCGDGSVFLGTEYNNIHGMDVDGDSLFLCSAVPNYRKLSKYMKDFDVPSYDCITLLGLLEHLTTQEIAYLFNDIVGAKSVYITVPNADSFHRVIGVYASIIPNQFHLSKQDYEIGHKQYFNNFTLRQTLIPLIQENNFQIQLIGSAGFKFDTSLNMIPYLENITAIERAAANYDLIGQNRFAGAELFVYLTKKE